VRKNYPSYKESGVEWIGGIPEHWKIGKFKYYFNLRSGTAPKNFDKSIGDIITYGANGVIGFTDEINLFDLSILIGRVGSSGEIHLNKKPCWVTDNCLIVSPRQKYNLHFLYYLLKKTNLTRFTTKTSQPLITASIIKDIKTIFPPIAEQKQIANFLDYKTQLIDKLIDKTKKKIELLKERRAALINHCVTKGLNPGAEMKDSGIEWIGKIPVSWKLTKIGYISSVIDPQPDHRAPKIDENGYPYIGIRDIDEKGNVNINSCRTVELKAIEKQEKSYTISNKDLIFCKVGTLGFSRFFKKPKVRFSLSATLVIIKVNKNYDPRFINYSLQSNFVFNQISYEATGSTRKALGIEVIRNFKICIPSIKIQNEISDYLDKQTTKINIIIQKENNRIELLQEYRKSLISEVVTGKIDVRDEVVA